MEMRLPRRYMVGAMVSCPGAKDYILDRKFADLAEARVCFEYLKTVIDPHGPIVGLRIYDLLDGTRMPLEIYDGKGLEEHAN